MENLSKADRDLGARNVIRHILFEELRDMSIQSPLRNVLYSHGNYESEGSDL
jgi:hypothetical protein